MVTLVLAMIVPDGFPKLGGTRKIIQVTDDRDLVFKNMFKNMVTWGFPMLGNPLNG